MQAIFLNLFYFTEKGIFPYGVDRIKVLIVQSREFGKESIGKDSTHFDKELIHFDWQINNLCLCVTKYRLFATGLNYKMGIDQKIYE